MLTAPRSANSELLDTVRRERQRIDGTHYIGPMGESGQGQLRISEQAVFRWVVIVTVAALSIIALTLATRPLFGALWMLVLVCAAAVYAYRALKQR